MRRAGRAIELKYVPAWTGLHLPVQAVASEFGPPPKSL
jgi:hypothetical protein